MKKYNQGILFLLLAICIFAIALGYASSKNIPQESTKYLKMNVDSVGVVIPQNLVTDEVKEILLKVSQEHPGNVTFTDSEVTLTGSETVDDFKQLINESNITFDMKAAYTFYRFDNSTVTDGPYIINSRIPQNSVIIPYSELEKLLNGDDETISYYREFLDTSQHNLPPSQNATVVKIKKNQGYSFPDNASRVAIMTTNSAEE